MGDGVERLDGEMAREVTVGRLAWSCKLMSGTQHPLSQASEGVSDFGRGSASGTRPQGEGPEKDSCSMDESGRAGRGEVRGGGGERVEEGRKNLTK